MSHRRYEPRQVAVRPAEWGEGAIRILERITDGFFALDREWRFVYANPRAEEILGLTDLVQSGRSIWEVFPEAVDSEFGHAYLAAVSDQQPRHVEAYYAPYDRWYEAHAHPSSDGLSVYFRDVTERRRSEEERHARDLRFELVTCATQEVIYDYDVSAGTSWRSSAIETVFGFARGEIQPTIEWWFDRIHDDDRPGIVRSFEEAVCGEASLWKGEYRARDGVGSWRHVLDRASIVRDQSGGAIRVVGARMDVTQQKRAEEEVRESREQARDLARRLIDLQEAERRRMSRDIHDLVGQALTAISINVNSLRGGLESGSEALARVDKVDALIAETVANVRAMATRLRPMMLDDLGLVPALRAEAMTFTDRTGIECFVVDNSNGEVPDSEAATAIFRIVQEALTNVARHSKARSATIVLHRTNAALCVEVRDAGSGFRAPTSPSLGLLGMKERALLIGGELSVRTVPGSGTVVSLSIPLVRAAHGKTPRGSGTGGGAAADDRVNPSRT